jgi:hypothetical protein
MNQPSSNKTNKQTHEKLNNGPNYSLAQVTSRLETRKMGTKIIDITVSDH